MGKPWDDPDADPLDDIRQIERDDRQRTGRPFEASQPDVPCETTGQRATRLRHSGARMCGPVPLTDADLDVVEKFMAWLRERKTRDA